MKKNIKVFYILSFCIFLLSTANSWSQNDTLDIQNMSREDVLNIPYEQLMELPLDVLMQLADKMGVSLDELYEMILNKDVTSASKKEESSFESPLSSSVISYEDIKRSGATTIEEALRLVPGIIVRQKTNGNYDVHIRGNDNLPPGNMLLYSENSMTLVMIDNRVVYNYAHGGAFWETLPIGIEDIDRIEVIRGPASALYGPNAATGVIHIITKRFEEEKTHVNLSAQGGTTGTMIAGLNAGTKITDDLWININGNFQTRDRFQETFYCWELDDYYPIDVIDTMKVPSTGESYERDPIYDRFDDPSMSRINYGGNLNVFYILNKDVSFDLSGGYQNSDVITTPLDNPYYCGTRRLSESEYIDFKTRAYGFNAQLSYMMGPQDVAIKKQGMQYDMRILDAVLEYDYKLGDNLGIRPGISFRQANYDDRDYVDYAAQEGFLNGDRMLQTFSYGVRLDYTGVENLRLIGAVRGDKYNYPDKNYFTYQAIASYNVNDKHLFRVVHSRANRSPFIIDVYANFDWARLNPITDPDHPILPNGGHFYFEGNKELELATVDMFEFGYRIKPIRNIQADFEIYHSRSKNFDSFVLDSLNLQLGPANEMSGYGTLPSYGLFTYRNLDVEARQTGFTANISIVLTQKLYLKLHGTIQKTELYDLDTFTVNNSLDYMGTNAVVAFMGPGHYYLDSTSVNVEPYGLLPQYTIGGNAKNEERITRTHKSTPSFYGGITINYQPISKMNINMSGYMYGKQTLVHSMATAEIDPKVIINTKISYKVWKESTIFINARNLLNDKTKEFAFMDDIGGLYLIGLNLSF